MNKKLITDIIEEKLKSILIKEASRGINNENLLKYLFINIIKLYGLLLGIPIDEFDGGIGEMENDNTKCKILDKKKYEDVKINIQKIIIELFQKRNSKIMVDCKGCHERIKINQLTDILSEKIVYIKFSVIEIEIFPSINYQNDMFILKDSVNGQYYVGDDRRFKWNYKKTEAKIFKDLDELAKLIINNNFTNIKLIKYSIDDIISALNEEEDRKIENELNRNPQDIEWFNSFEYSHWMEMAHISAHNNWLTGKENKFLMEMGKYKKDNREPYPKQINWLKKINEKYNNLNN